MYVRNITFIRDLPSGDYDYQKMLSLQIWNNFRKPPKYYPSQSGFACQKCTIEEENDQENYSVNTESITTDIDELFHSHERKN